MVKATPLARREEELQALSRVANIPMTSFGMLNTWLQKPPANNKTFVLAPGIIADAKWSHYLAERLVPDLLKFELTPEAQQYGLVGFGRCLNMAGYSQNPIGFVARDNEVESSKISDLVFRGLDVAASVVGPLMRAHLKDAGIAYRTGANTGAQLFSTSTALKGKLLEHLLPRFDQFLEMFERDDFAGIRREFGASAYALLRRRHQADSVAVDYSPSGFIKSVKFKERVVADGMGSFVAADKRLPDEFSPYTCANRERKVVAIDWIYNTPEVILSSLWAYVSRRFERHWHVGNARIELDNHKAHYAHRRPKAYDVKTYDRRKPLVLLDYETDMLVKHVGLASWVGKMSKLTNAPPFLSNPVWMDGRDGFHIVGDHDEPFVGREQRAIGLPSGKGLTAAWHGKFANGTYCWIAWSMVFHRPLTVESFIKYLEHDDSWPVWAWNCGDDVCFWLSEDVTSRDEELFTQAYSQLCSCWQLEPEEYPSFLSYQIRQGSDGYWTAYPDAARGSTNILDRESSLPGIYAARRLPNTERLRATFGLDGTSDPRWVASSNKFANYGFQQRSELYSRLNPAWPEVEQCIRYHLDKFQPGTTRLMQEAALFEEAALNEIVVKAGNALDIELLANPSYVYYRPEYEDVIRDARRSVLFLYIDSERAKPITAAMAA